MRIATAGHLFGIRDADSLHKWNMGQGAKRLARLGIDPRRIGSPSDPNAAAPKAIAYVNHGRWVADCPAQYCRNAMVISPGAPYLCAECFNVDAGYRYRLVEWPANRGEIEELLAERPVPEVANWYPGEDADHLREENAAFRDGVLR